MAVVKFSHGPETILFAIDLDPEMTTEDARGRTRLEVVKHAVTVFVHAKRRLSPQHKFGLVTLGQTEAVLHPASITSSIDDFRDCLLQLQPEDVQPQFISSTSSSGSSSSSSTNPFDMGSVITAVSPFIQQQQQQQQHCIEHIAGGTLSPSPTVLNSSNSSRISQPQQQQLQQLRVILIYGRSRLPAPILATNADQGLALDCVYLHDKPQPGFNNPQEVYSALEELVDSIALKVGHAGFVYEASAGRSAKLLSCMTMLLSHPSQRRAQVDTMPPVDLSTAPVMLLPSDAANLASGVPIMSPGRLPAASAVSAWSKPLTVTNTVINIKSNKSTKGSSSGGVEAWGDLPAGVISSSSGGAGVWGAGAAASSAAAALTPWSDPWNDSSHSAAFGSDNVLLLGQTQAPGLSNPVAEPAAAAAAAAASGMSDRPVNSAAAAIGGSSSSNRASAIESVAIGVPAGVVAGIPDRQPSYSLDDSVALGFAMPDQGVEGVQSLSHPDNNRNRQRGAGSSSSASAGASPVGQGLRVDASFDNGLDDLAAVLMASAIEDVQGSQVHSSDSR